LNPTGKRVKVTENKKYHQQDPYSSLPDFVFGEKYQIQGIQPKQVEICLCGLVVGKKPQKANE
jgi:hypothetical protein